MTQPPTDQPPAGQSVEARLAEIAARQPEAGHFHVLLSVDERDWLVSRLREALLKDEQVTVLVSSLLKAMEGIPDGDVVQFRLTPMIRAWFDELRSLLAPDGG